MSTGTATEASTATIEVNPGICGFPCTVRANKTGQRMVAVKLSGCECEKVKQLSSNLTEVTLKELFEPITRNPVYVAAEQSGCHPSCTIPAAIVKAAEVALGLALPMDVRIQFLNSKTSIKQKR